MLEKKVNLLLNFRGYQIESETQEKYYKDLSIITKRDGKRLLLRIIQESQLISGKVGVRQVRKMREKIIKEGYDGGILIGTGFSYSAKKEARSKDIEIIEISKIPSFNIFKHDLVPKHEILSKEEAEELLKKHHISPYQLPHIRRSDPAIFLIGAKPGDIIKIIRKSPTAGIYVTYRYVV
ncbi:MAG: DNA-directed RNA polymerase subunit H [Candidatus Bathyarchaeota archaeon B63]|nr:MAG: DNA-directed RNA polymerase subunit H [Candidatus Bathyarchaeota archaeon B63]